MEKELLTVKDAAAALSVSQRQVWKLHASGRLPMPVRLGRSVRWKRDELLAWLEAGCPSRDVWEAMRRATIRPGYGGRSSRRVSFLIAFWFLLHGNYAEIILIGIMAWLLVLAFSQVGSAVRTIGLMVIRQASRRKEAQGA